MHANFSIYLYTQRNEAAPNNEEAYIFNIYIYMKLEFLSLSYSVGVLTNGDNS